MQIPTVSRYFHKSHRRFKPGTVELAYDLHEPTKPRMKKTENPILFLHGLFGSKKNNRTLSKALARDTGRYVYALDLRNHGDSPHIPQHDYHIMAADVSRFISTHKLIAPTVIGHSMGAKTAMTLALCEPDLVTDIVAVDNAPVDATLASDFARYIQGMRKIEQFALEKQSEADNILQEYEKSLPIRQFLLSNLYRPMSLSPTKGPARPYKFRIPVEILGKTLHNLGDFPFKDPSQVRFLKPALFVRGTLSKYVPDEVIPLIGQFFPYFKLVDIEAGHWVTSEKPEEFKYACLEFFSRESPS